MPFLIGLAPDLFNSRGEPTFGADAMSLLEMQATHGIAWEKFPDRNEVLSPDVLGRYDALYVNTQKVTAESLADGPTRLRIVARHGVGFDSIDAEALTRHGILLTNTPLAVRRPVATVALTFMLVLAQRLMLKDRLTREGRWKERGDYMGTGLTGRVLGIIGVGGIARELARLVAPFEMRILGAGRDGTRRGEPDLSAGPFQEWDDDGIVRTDLATLLRTSDFVVVACPLTPETFHLVGPPEIALMRSTSFLINVARGPIVDEAAAIQALRDGTIAGAGLDVFEQEPVQADNPLLNMDNVVLSPHSLCWTDETFGGIARTAITSIIDALQAREPKHVVNPKVLQHSKVRSWLERANDRQPEVRL